MILAFVKFLGVFSCNRAIYKYFKVKIFPYFLLDNYCPGHKVGIKWNIETQGGKAHD